MIAARLLDTLDIVPSCRRDMVVAQIPSLFVPWTANQHIGVLAELNT